MEEMKCFHCNKSLTNKPWLTVAYPKDEITFHSCSYLCSRVLQCKLRNYGDYIVNKEDFTGRDFLRPVLNISKKKDITTGFGMNDIRNEIRMEEERIQSIEKEYENEYESDEDFSEYNS